jgi:hypothetical protein
MQTSLLAMLDVPAFTCLLNPDYFTQLRKPQPPWESSIKFLRARLVAGYNDCTWKDETSIWSLRAKRPTAVPERKRLFNPVPILLPSTYRVY